MQGRKIVSGDQCEQSEHTFAVSAPQISLPNGGGAIRGIGEKLAADPVTGIGSLPVPFYKSPRRSGVGPQLSRSYDSGADNGLFDFGWSLALPSITCFANHRLKYVFYGNRTPYFPGMTSGQPVPLRADWCFGLVVDWGKRDRNVLSGWLYCDIDSRRANWLSERGRAAAPVSYCDQGRHYHADGTDPS
jgi:hypothetical protein